MSTWTPTRLAPIALVALVACSSLSPEAQETHQYLKQLQPLLVENGHLAEQVLLLASDVYNEKGEAADRSDTWTVDVVPLAEHLHHQAQAVEPPDGWQVRHDRLVEIWGDRSQAYRSLSEAMVLADLDKWREARSKATAARVAEDEWFKEVNSELAMRNLSVDPTP